MHDALSPAIAEFDPHRSMAEQALSRTGQRSFWPLVASAERVASGIYLISACAFLWMGKPQMVALEVASALFHAIQWQWLRWRPHPLAAWLIALHLATHAACAVVLLGWQSGFAFPLILLVPLVFLTDLRSASVKVGVAASTIALYVGLDLLMQQMAPLAPVPARGTEWLRVFNTVATLGFLSYLAWIHVGLIMRAERSLLHAAHTDALTGLANRRRLRELAEYECLRDRGMQPVSFVLCDIDRFKSVNDRHGHGAGDRVLSAVAAVLRDGARAGDCVARWGGEEFLLLLPDTKLEAAAAVAGRLRDAIGMLSCSTPEGQSLPLTATFGVSCRRPHETVDDVIARADAALYQGKQQGRDRVVMAA